MLNLRLMREIYKTLMKKDIEQNFINYVNDTIIEDEEHKTLKHLYKDYQNMLENFVFLEL